jgi:ribosomal protein S18 acetylase RimI-like enzyme
MINYIDSLESISPQMLSGFFEGWPKKPSPSRHYEILSNSAEIVLAVDFENRRVVGFINAISDGILSAYIPLLEVLPEYRGNGIGLNLVKKMMAKLSDLYMVDLVCDRELEKFYGLLGFKLYHAMIYRNFKRQDGSSPDKS